MSIEGVRGYHDFLHNRRCDDARADCGPRSSFAVHGNTVETRHYEITASNHDHGTVTVRDKETGKVVWAGGDPHLGTSDGDYTSFHDGNLTLNLPKGDLKITFDPTEKTNGVAYLQRAVITDGADAAVINFDAAGNPTTRGLSGQGYRLDRWTPDGLDLVSRNGSLADFAVRGGPEIRGNDIANLDAFRYHGPFGDSRPSLPTRPHIGLPNGRGDGPFSWWPRHSSGPHHRVDNCGQDGGRHDNWQVRNLLDQLRSFQWLAHNGPWGMRVHARHEMHRIQDRLRELMA